MFTSNLDLFQKMSIKKNFNIKNILQIYNYLNNNLFVYLTKGGFENYLNKFLPIDLKNKCLSIYKEFQQEYNSMMSALNHPINDTWTIFDCSGQVKSGRNFHYSFAINDKQVVVYNFDKDMVEYDIVTL